MRIFQSSLWIFLLLLAGLPGEDSVKNPLPAFGRDTVLVWKVLNQEYGSQFVARIAEFSPDRFLEWEEGSSQGTIFMPSRDLLSAKDYVSSSLFQAGSDTRSKQSTTLWLSQTIYRDLKSKKKTKCSIDGVVGQLTYKGDNRLEVEINKSMRELPVIVVEDGRGSERWFLDREENPLLVKHITGKYSQTLVSITTNRPNTLRWIKGDKLTNPPR